MTRLEEIAELFEFNAWATARVFEATASLSEEEFTRDLGNSFPSIRDTLVHIIGGEWVWLTRWHGTSPTAFPAAPRTHPDIVRRWEDINVEREKFLRSLGPHSLDVVVAYTSFAGVDFAFPLWQMLRHVVNHSSYHRGQVTTMLKQLGHKPISTDWILMYQERQLAAR